MFDTRRRRSEAHEAPTRPRPLMNVTPLVDVVLVLLIIFMVVIPALQQGQQIELAGILNVDAESESKGQPFALSITRDHQVFFEEEPVSYAALEAKLRAAIKAQPNRRVVVRADKAAEYAKVRAIYRAVQQVGFAGVSLRVNRHREEP
jgi:biopolymer transport protein ExbD/biopolymer transport protein TolR